MQAGLGVRNRFDDRRVCAHHVLQNVLGVAGSADAEHLQRRPLLVHLALELAQDLDRVFDGIPLRERVGFQQHAAAGVLRHQHGLGGRRAAVQTDEAFHHFLCLELRGRVLVIPVARLEFRQLFRACRQARRHIAFRGLLLAAPVLDIPLQALPALVTPDAILLALAELDCADRREILRVFGGADQVFRRHALGQREVTLLPNLGNVVLPALLHARDVTVRPAQQQDHGPQRVAARQHRKVLHHDGLEQRRHQLIRRHAGFLQPVDIGLCKHAALARDGVQTQAVVAHFAQLLGGNAQLGVDLVDHRAGPARALVIHRGKLFLAASLRVFLEDDDLRVLPAQLDHRPAFRVQFLHRERDRVDFLYELRAQIPGHPVPAGAGDEDAAFLRLEAVDLGLESLEELERLLRLLGVVPLVIAPDDLVCERIGHHGLHRRGADVEPNHVASVQHDLAPQAAAAAAVRPSLFIRSAMCSTKFAATPMTPLVGGTRYMGRFNSG